MVLLAVFAVLFIATITVATIRISISCIYWFMSTSKDKALAFKLYFPYYIMLLFGICLKCIISFNFDPFAIFYFSSVFMTALLIWRFDLNKAAKRKNTFKNETTTTITDLS